MNDELFQMTKEAAYFLWEYSGCDNALALWHCCEDLASYFEKKGYTCKESMSEILSENIYDLRRIAFVRHIAYRVFIYTKNQQKLSNWYVAEKLLANGEWLGAICAIAKIYGENKTDFSKLTAVKSDIVKQHYMEQN